MALHKHEPISEDQMNWASPQNTICETLREVYHRSTDPEAKLKCRIATAMAKAMTQKLTEYKRNWQKGFWAPNDRFERATGLKPHSKPIDVLFLAWDDNANTGYRFWKCAQHLGLNSVMFKGKPHAFGYPEQAPIHPSLANKPLYGAPVTVMAPGLESLINSARVVHLIASTYPMVAVNWKAVNVVVQHGGTAYRQHPDACNRVFGPVSDATIVQCPDLLNLGAKNESLIYYPVDADQIRPDFGFKHPDKLTIGHFPSNPEVKGTDAILNVLGQLDQDFEYIGSDGGRSHILPWEQNIERLKQCDIVIETCNANQGDKVFGEWGNTALEAAASGCVVVSNTLTRDLYHNEYGKLGVQVANNPEQLHQVLTELLSLPRADIATLKHETRQWAESSHGIEATANRLWDKVYHRFF